MKSSGRSEEKRRKCQAASFGDPPKNLRSNKLQAASIKHPKIQASSDKRQATSSRVQATSLKLQAPRYLYPHKVYSS